MGIRKPIASVMLRDRPHYKVQAFMRGLTVAGYDVRAGLPPTIAPSDVLVIWNRYAHFDEWARRFGAAGAKVLVAENGYIGKTTAIARNNHNGPGHWYTGQEPRWSRLGIELQPWRKDGRHILVLPQRGVGPPGVAMPKGWCGNTVARLQSITTRPVKVREHPGAERPSLAPDLKDAWACVTWGSGAGIKALIAGVPVFHDLPGWIGGAAAKRGIENIEAPFMGDRAPMLESLAWAQWTVEEIEAGTPFRYLLCE